MWATCCRSSSERKYLEEVSVTIIKHSSMNVLWTRSMYFECHRLQIRCLQPCFLVLLRHLSVLVFFMLSWMAGLAGSPLPSAFSRVLAKPTTIIGICTLFVVDQFQWIAEGWENIELCIIFLDSGLNLMVHCSSERTQDAVMPTAMHFKKRHFWQLRRLATLT